MPRSTGAGPIIFVPFMTAFAGVERLILGLSRFLHAQGHRHTIVCFADSIDFRSRAAWPVTVHQLAPIRNPIAEGWHLYRYFKKALGPGGPAPLLFDLKGAFYAGLFPMPAYHLHLTDPPSLLPFETSNHAWSLRHHSESRPARAVFAGIRGEIVHRINRRGTAGARSVIAMSERIAAELRSIYAVAPQVVRPGAAEPRTSPVQSGADGRRMLSICRLEASKRLDWMLDALAALRDSATSMSSVDSWTLHFVGEGSERARLQAHAERLGLAPRVVFHGAVSDERREALFHSADLFLMPAAQGYGLPALEALARRIPVIVHRDSGVSEILGSSPWVEIIDGGVDQLSRAMRTMMQRIAGTDLAGAAAPRYPTESDWAYEISRICGWI